MDPSSSFDSQASDSVGQPPEQTVIITGMDPNLYKAAAEGKTNIIEDETLCSQLTPNKNTVLHIYLKATKKSASASFVEEILTKYPSLLWQTNTKDETPLHMAARCGHFEVVKVIIEHAYGPQELESGVGRNEAVRKMIRMINKEKNTALHEAVRYGKLEVVKLLTKEDPDFVYAANDAGETPLYLAAERRYLDVVVEILETCKSPAHSGPLDRTALHAAVFWEDEEMITKIVDKKGADIIKQADKKGWTPLHYAAYIGRLNATRLLLNLIKFSSVAYMKDEKGRTALHIAVDRGHFNIIKEIVSSCPDCCEIVDNRGQNMFHYIAVNDYLDKIGGTFEDNIGGIFEEDWSFSDLLNEKDADGNTPLHLYSKSDGSSDFLMNHPRVDKRAINKQNMDAADIALTSDNCGSIFFKKREIIDCINGSPRVLIPKIVKIGGKFEDEKVRREEASVDDEYRKNMKETAGAHLIVATLIATVTFTAGITMPGGYTEKNGTAILGGNAAFGAFVIFNTIAMLLSSCAVFTHLYLPSLYREIKFDEWFKLFLMAFILIMLAMGAMVLAFITGTYAVLAHSLGLAIPTTLVGLCFFGFVYLLFKWIDSWALKINQEWD